MDHPGLYPARRAWLIRLGLLLAVALTLAPRMGLAQQYSIRYHDQTEGLGNLSIKALAQDHDGYLWIGTENGLYRYDGSEFVRHDAAGSRVGVHVTALLVAPDSALWVGTPGGLYRSQRGELRPVHQAGAIIPIDPLENIVADGDDRVLVVSRQQLLTVARTSSGEWAARPYFDAPQQSSHPELRSISHVHVGRDGALWIVCGRMLCRFKNGLLQTSNPAGADAHGWSEIFDDSRGGLWLRNSRRILQRPAGEAAFVDRTPPHVERGAESLSVPIVEDADGRILTNVDTGIARWDGRQWTRVDAANGLVSPGGVGALLIDRDGGLWLGTAGSGLAQWIGYRHLAAWTAKDGILDDDVWSIFRDRDNRLHVGSGTGVARMLPGERRFAEESRTSSVSPAASLAQDHAGNLWMGDFSGSLFMVPANTKKRVLFAKLPLIFRLVVDSTGRLWICTKQGLFVIDAGPGKQRLRRVDTDINPDPAHGPRTFAGCESSSGGMWFTTDAGLLRWDGSRLAPVPPRPEDGKAGATPSFKTIACIVGDDAWASGGGRPGVWRVHQSQGTATLTQIVPTPLADRNFVSLVQDHRGWLWAGTDAGVAVWNGTVWRVVDQDGGLVWNDCNQYAIREDADGSIWVGTGRGAQHIEHVDSLFPGPHGSVLIAALARGQTPVDLSVPVKLPWANAPLEASFASLSFESRRSDRFQYRLLGLDEAWAVSAGSNVTFSALPAGHYRLEAMTVNATLQKRSPVASLEFEVLPAWWQTTVFRSACLLATAGAAWSLYAWRMRNQARRQRFLEMMVAERTRELEASREQMRQLALKDGLTNILNRRALMETLGSELDRSIRELKELTLVIVDADHFKRINDTHGHPAGDAVLRTIAQRLLAATRSSDTVGRYGGEEFMLILPGLRSGTDEGRRRVEAFHRGISEEPIAINATRTIAVTCSFGVATLHPSQSQSAEELIAQADAALYKAKEGGRNQIAYAASE